MLNKARIAEIDNALANGAGIEMTREEMEILSGAQLLTAVELGIDEDEDSEEVEHGE